VLKFETGSRRHGKSWVRKQLAEYTARVGKHVSTKTENGLLFETYELPTGVRVSLVSAAPTGDSET